MTKSSIGTITTFIISGGVWRYNSCIEYPRIGTTIPIVNVYRSTILPLSIVWISSGYPGCTYSDSRTVTRGCDTVTKFTVTHSIAIRRWSNSCTDSLPCVIQQKRTRWAIRVLLSICVHFICIDCRSNGSGRIFTPDIHINAPRTTVSIRRTNYRRRSCTRTHGTQSFSAVEHHNRFTGQISVSCTNKYRLRCVIE